MGIITDLSLRWLYRLTDLIHIKCFLVAQLVKNHLQCKRPQFNSWAEKIHWRTDRLPTPVFLGFPGGSAGKKNPPAMRETWVGSLGWEDPLEKGKATHSSILACIVHGVAN